MHAYGLFLYVITCFWLLQVYITLGDENDNSPGFMQRDYFAVIIESAEPGSSVVKITANDFDDGENAKLFFFEQGGDPIGKSASTELLNVNM